MSADSITANAEHLAALIREQFGIVDLLPHAYRLLGFGLTLRPTPHRFTFGNRTVYAFCASDAVLFPAILERPGVIDSTCPPRARPGKRGHHG